MSNLTAKYQWGIILGFFFVMRGLRALANSNEALQPFLFPVIILLTIFAFSTWIVKPLSNLFLRFHPYGKFLLDRKEKMSSDFVAICLGICLINLLFYIFLSDVRFMFFAAFGFFMMVPMSVIFVPSKYKLILIYTMAMALLGIIALGTAIMNSAAFSTLASTFLIGFIAFQFLANFLIIRNSNS